MYATLMIRNSNASFYFIANKEAVGLDWLQVDGRFREVLSVMANFVVWAIAFRVLLGGGGGE